MQHLSRFPNLRSSDPDEAFVNMRSRHPGLAYIKPHHDRDIWSIAINAFSLQDVGISFGLSAGLDYSAHPDEHVRVLISSGGTLEFSQGSFRQDLKPGSLTWVPEEHSGTVGNGAECFVLKLPKARLEQALAGDAYKLNLSCSIQRSFRLGNENMLPLRMQMEGIPPPWAAWR